MQPKDKLSIYLIFDQDRLIAFFPLYLKHTAYGFELRFLGTGEPESAEVCSEFQDFVIHPDYLEASLHLLSQQVRHLKRCYRISFENIHQDAICAVWLKTHQPSYWYHTERHQGGHYAFPVEQDETAQIKQLPQSTLRRYARRFLKQDHISVQYCETVEDIERFFDVLIGLHTEQWHQRHKPGAFTSKDFRKFHVDLSRRLLKKNKLLLFTLAHHSKAIAAFYGFYHEDTLYYYQSGISQDSPLPNTGIAIHLVALRKARQHQCRDYDLMKGSFHSYKQGYTMPVQTVVSVSYTQPLIATIFFIRRCVMKLYKQCMILFRQ